MDPPQQREVHFPGSAPPATHVPWNATAFPAPQHAQPAPPPYPRPDQLRGHAGVVRDVMVSDRHCEIPFPHLRHVYALLL